MSRTRLLTLLFFGGIALLNLLTAALLVVSLQTDIRGVESNVIYTIQYALKTGLLYTDPEQLPYAITQYSPLFYVISVKLAGLFGLAPGQEVYKIYILSRLLSVLASVGISGLVYLIATRQLRLSGTAGLLAALLAFIIPVPWFFLARPDALVSLFLFGTVAAFLQYLGGQETDSARGKLWLGFSAMLAVLALFSKQNGLIILAAPGLYLLLNKRFKDLVLYGFCCGVFLVLWYVALLKDYQPGVLQANLLKGVDNGIDLLAYFKKVIFVYFSEFTLLVALTAALFVLAFRQKELIRNAPLTVRFIGFFFLLITAFSFLSAVKAGSAHNYLIDSLLLSLFLIGYGFRHINLLQDAVLNPVVRLFAIIGLAVFVLNYSLENFYVYAGEGSLKAFYNRKKGYDAEVKLAAQLKMELQRSPGTYLLSTNRNINNHLFEFIVFPQSEIADKPHQWKVYDYDNFEEDIIEGKIKFLLLPEDDKPDRFAGERLSGFYLYQADTLEYNLYIWHAHKPDSILSEKVALQK